MAYAIKYSADFLALHTELPCRLELHLKDYAGASSVISVADREPVSTSSAGSKKDDFKIIQGSELIFNFYSLKEDNEKYVDIIESEYKDWKVFYYINSAIEFVGYVKPENIETVFLDDKYFVSLSATDALADLKDIPFPATSGRDSILNVLRTALSQIGIELDFLIQLNTYEVLLGSSILNSLHYTYIQISRFIEEKDGYFFNTNCYEVIESVLAPFVVTFRQVNGHYKITNVNEVSSYVYLFDWATMAQQSRTPKNLVTNIDAYSFLNRGSLQKISPAKYANVTYRNRNISGNILPNTWSNINAWDFFTANQSGLQMSVAILVAVSGYKYGESIPFYIEKKADEDYLLVRFNSKIANLAPPVGYEPFLVVEYKSALKTTWTVATGLLLLDTANRYHEIIIPVDGTSSNYQVRFAVFIVAGTTRIDVQITDLFGYPVYPEDDVTFDKLFKGSAYNSKAIKTLEKTIFFGDGLQANDIGNYTIGTNPLSSIWNRYGKTDNQPIAYLYAQTLLNNNALYRSYVQITALDPDCLINVDGILELDGKYYTVIGYTRSYFSGSLELELIQLLTAEVTSLILTYNLTSVDGESNGTTSGTIGGPPSPTPQPTLQEVLVVGNKAKLPIVLQTADGLHEITMAIDSAGNMTISGDILVAGNVRTFSQGVPGSTAVGKGTFLGIQDLTILQAIDTTNADEYPDKWALIVEDEAYWYRFDRNSVAATSTPDIIKPTVGPGAWYRMAGGSISLSQASAIYVSKVGDDQNTGVKSDKPKLTLTSAITQANTIIAGGIITSVRIEIQDAGTYVEANRITIPSKVHVSGLSATFVGRVDVEGLASFTIHAHYADGNNDRMVRHGGGTNGPAIYVANICDGRGIAGTVTGVSNIFNNAGTGKNLFVRVGILYVAEGGTGIGDVTDGDAGHIHFLIADIYLAGNNAVGMLGSSNGVGASNIIGYTDHILEIGTPTGTIGIKMDHATALVRITAGEIVADTAWNITAGDLYISCPRVVGTIVGSPTNRMLGTVDISASALAAIAAANTPSGSNPFATVDDLVYGGGGGTGVFAPVADITTLKTINTTVAIEYPDKWGLIVEGENHWYRLDRDSTVAESLPDIVAPTTGTGRWYRVAVTTASQGLTKVGNDTQLGGTLVAGQILIEGDVDSTFDVLISDTGVSQAGLTIQPNGYVISAFNDLGGGLGRTSFQNVLAASFAQGVRNTSNSKSTEIRFDDSDIVFKPYFNNAVAEFNGAKYNADNRSRWGTINNANRYIPDVGWVVDYVGSAAPHTYSRIIWVDYVNGSDSNSGQFGKPVKTITQAWTLRKAVGIISSTVIIKVMSVGSLGNVTLDGTGMSGQVATYIESSSATANGEGTSGNSQNAIGTLDMIDIQAVYLIGIEVFAGNWTQTIGQACYLRCVNCVVAVPIIVSAASVGLCLYSIKGGRWAVPAGGFGGVVDMDSLSELRMVASSATIYELNLRKDADLIFEGSVTLTVTRVSNNGFYGGIRFYYEGALIVTSFLSTDRFSPKYVIRTGPVVGTITLSNPSYARYPDSKRHRFDPGSSGISALNVEDAIKEVAISGGGSNHSLLQQIYLHDSLGNDITGDGTSELPWATLAKAATMITRSCVIYLNDNCGFDDVTLPNYSIWIMPSNNVTGLGVNDSCYVNTLTLGASTRLYLKGISVWNVVSSGTTNYLHMEDCAVGADIQIPATSGWFTNVEFNGNVTCRTGIYGPDTFRSCAFRFNKGLSTKQYSSYYDCNIPYCTILSTSVYFWGCIITELTIDTVGHLPSFRNTTVSGVYGAAGYKLRDLSLYSDLDATFIGTSANHTEYPLQLRSRLLTHNLDNNIWELAGSFYEGYTEAGMQAMATTPVELIPATADRSIIIIALVWHNSGGGKNFTNNPRLQIYFEGQTEIIAQSPDNLLSVATSLVKQGTITPEYVLKANTRLMMKASVAGITTGSGLFFSGLQIFYRHAVTG